MIDFNSLEVKRKINLLAEICHYGIQWNRDLPSESNDSYIIGGIETTAFILSCCIVQWLGLECCGTAETRDFLEMEKALHGKGITIEVWEKRITKFIKAEIEHQKAN